MSFQNCTAAYRAGIADIPKSSPNYARHLDRDNDGIACESKDAPSWFVPVGNGHPNTTPSPEPTATPHKTHTAVGGHTPALPKTGPGEVTAIGGLVLVLGTVAVLAFRRKLVRFSA